MYTRVEALRAGKKRVSQTWTIVNNSQMLLIWSCWTKLNILEARQTWETASGVKTSTQLGEGDWNFKLSLPRIVNWFVRWFRDSQPLSVCSCALAYCSVLQVLNTVACLCQSDVLNFIPPSVFRHVQTEHSTRSSCKIHTHTDSFTRWTRRDALTAETPTSCYFVYF